jgi:hypothetical protein
MPDISRKGMTAAAFPGVLRTPTAALSPKHGGRQRKHPTPSRGKKELKSSTYIFFPALEKGRDHGQENPRRHYRIGSLTRTPDLRERQLRDEVMT